MFKALSMLTFILVAFSASGELKKIDYFYTHSELRLYDLEQMLEIIDTYENKSDELINNASVLKLEEAENNALDLLRRSFKVALSRPYTSDNINRTALSKVSASLKRKQALRSSYIYLCTEAVAGVKNKKINVKYRSTYLYILENMLTELRPQLKGKDKLDRSLSQTVYKKIARGKIKVDQSVVKYREKKGLTTISPSETAQNKLDKLFKK